MKVPWKARMAAPSRSSAAVATCSGRGAHAPTCPRIADIRAITSTGPTAHPTRRPVAAKALLIPSMKTVKGAISGRRPVGVTCVVPPKQSIQYTWS